MSSATAIRERLDEWTRATGNRAGSERLSKRMESIAGRLQRDPKIETEWRRLAPELALNIEHGRSIEQELAQSVGHGRDRGRDRRR